MRLSVVMSSLILSSLAGLLPGATGLPASSGAGEPAADRAHRPVVVELFTSEGCSSCPPADALLLQLDRMQPVPGALVIAIGEHVDYWDHLGWRDPFSSSVFSRRQEGYGRRFHRNGVYTPQAVVDGTLEAVGSDATLVYDAIRQSSKADKVPIRISPVFTNSQGLPAVHVEVNPRENAGPSGSGQLILVLAENAVVSHVRSGENSGRKLDHVAVVRSLTEPRSLDATGAFSAEIPLTGAFGQWSGKRMIAFVQDRNYGRIRGAALRLLSPAATK